MAADKADSTPTNGLIVDPPLIYGEHGRLSSREHAAEARRLAYVANAADDGYERSMSLAQWHATMAVYEALRESKT